MEKIDVYLQKLRQDGDVQLKQCKYVKPSLRQTPPVKVGIAHLVLRPRFLLADPTGCGKTPMTLGAFGFLKEKSPKFRLLVAATGSSIFQWYHSSLFFLSDLKPQVIGYDLETGNPISRFKRYDAYENSEADILILSYHQLARDAEVILEHIDNLILVFDEVQHLKSHTGKLLFPYAQKLSAKSRYAWGLTATPIMNRIEEIFGIMEVIYPGFFGGSIRRFEEAYCEKGFESINGHVVAKTMGYKNMPQLMLIMRPFYLRRKAHEINQYLPIPVTKEVVITMEQAQQRSYESIVKKKFFPDPLHPRKINKLASLVYAQMVSDAPEAIGLEGGSSKWTELLRLFREEIFDEKVIIYSRFRMVIDWLSRKLQEEQIKHVCVTGAVNKLDREINKNIFNQSPTNVILINDAGGEAIDLQTAGIIIFFDLPWSWGKFIQVVGRARRIGSKFSKILLILFVNRNTIDQHVYNTLYKKEQLTIDTFGLDQSTLELSQEGIGTLFDKVKESVSPLSASM